MAKIFPEDFIVTISPTRSESLVKSSWFLNVASFKGISENDVMRSLITLFNFIQSHPQLRSAFSTQIDRCFSAELSKLRESLVLFGVEEPYAIWPSSHIPLPVLKQLVSEILLPWLKACPLERVPFDYFVANFPKKQIDFSGLQGNSIFSKVYKLPQLSKTIRFNRAIALTQITHAFIDAAIANPKSDSFDKIYAFYRSHKDDTYFNPETIIFSNVLEDGNISFKEIGYYRGYSIKSEHDLMEFINQFPKCEKLVQ